MHDKLTDLSIEPEHDCPAGQQPTAVWSLEVHAQVFPEGQHLDFEHQFLRDSRERHVFKQVVPISFCRLQLTNSKPQCYHIPEAPDSGNTPDWQHSEVMSVRQLPRYTLLQKMHSRIAERLLDLREPLQLFLQGLSLSVEERHLLPAVLPAKAMDLLSHEKIAATK